MIAWLAAKIGVRAAGIAMHVIGWLVIAAAALAPLWMAYRHGVTVTAARYELIAEERAMAVSAARTAAVETARGEERYAAAKSIAATEARMRAEKEENDALNHDITALRAGGLRVRNRLAAGRCADLDVRADAADPGRVAAARTGGLLPADAQFLLHDFGTEPDRIARKLTEAQAQLRICDGLNHASTSP